MRTSYVEVPERTHVVRLLAAFVGGIALGASIVVFLLTLIFPSVLIYGMLLTLVWCAAGLVYVWDTRRADQR